jgi:hypothetical protein
MATTVNRPPGFYRSRQIAPSNPAHSVRVPKYVVKKGKTPVWSREDAKTLLDSIPKDSVSGLRDLALIAAMFYSFARVSAVLKLRVDDYYHNGARRRLRLHEKGGKEHEMPVHEIWRVFKRHDLIRTREPQGFGGTVLPRSASALVVCGESMLNPSYWIQPVSQGGLYLTRRTGCSALSCRHLNCLGSARSPYSSSLVACWVVDNPNIVPSEHRGRHSRVPISLHRLVKNIARIRPIIIEAGRQEIQYRSTPDDRSGLRVNERSTEQVLV